MLKPLFAIAMLLAATVAQAQNEPLVQRDLSDRTGRFLDLSPSNAEPLYVVNAGGGSIRFEASGVKIEQTKASPASSKLKSIVIHPGLSYAFDGGNSVVPQGQKASTALYSSFVGPQSEWNLNRSSYAELLYQGVWSGVDAVFKGTKDGLKYQFELAAGANPAQVALRIGGAQSLRVTDDGALEWNVDGQLFRDGAPVAWQTNGNRKTKVSARYVTQQIDASTWRVSFELGTYDKALPLVIDPAWAAAAGLVGGNSNDVVNAVTRDSVNKITWVCGTTQASGTQQAFVARFGDAAKDATKTYVYGGNGNDSCRGIALDAQGKVYIAGTTDSTNFTMVGTPTDSKLRAAKLNPAATTQDQDAFFAKINPDDGTMLWSSLFGGAGDDQVNGVAVDATGRLYLTGFTLPTCTAGTCVPAEIGSSTTALSASNTGKKAFVARVAATGEKLEYFGVLNSDGDTNIGHAIAVDPATSAVVVAGETNTTDKGIPSNVPGYYQVPNARPTDTINNGDAADGFVARINPTGDGYEFFTLLTGLPDAAAVKADRAFGVKLLSADNSVLVVGETNSSNFPTNVTSLAGAPAPAGGTDGFVVRLSANGSNLLAKRYLGGTGYDSARSVIAAADGYYVLGNSAGALTNWNGSGQVGGLSQSALGEQDGFLARFVTASDTPDFWGLIGSGGPDAYYAMAAEVIDIDPVKRPNGRTVLFAGGVSSSNINTPQQGELRRIDSYGPPSAFDIQDGGGVQSAVILQDYADLKVLVKDSLGQPVPRVIVSFTAPAATLPSINTPGTTTVTSDVDGIATLTGVKANDRAGSQYSVTVTAGSATTSFKLTNLKADQTGFTASAATNPLAFNAITTLSGSGGLSGVASTFAFDPADTTATTFCQLVGSNQLKALAAGGTCKVIATDEGNSNYNPANASFTVSTIKAQQSAFALTPASNSITVGASTTLSLGGALSTGQKSLSVNPASQSICEIRNGNEVHALTSGTCQIIAMDDGDANYFSATASSQITITKGNAGALNVTATPASIDFSQTATISVAANASNRASTLVVSSGPCTLNGSELRPTGTGPCVVTATQAEDANYLESTGSVTVAISQAAQAQLVLTPSFGTTSPGNQVTLATSGGTTGGNVTYVVVSGSPSICTLSGNLIQAVAVGACTVQATMAGNGNYLDVTSGPITINIANQPQAAISVSVDKANIAPGGTATVTASGGSGVINYSYTLVSGANACNLNASNGVVTAKAVGSCVVGATNPASTGFDAASSTSNVTINVANQPQAAIELNADKTSIAPGEKAQLTATGGSGVISFSYALVSGASYCDLNTSTGQVTAKAIGTCVVTASNPASTGFDAATSNSVNITVANHAQAAITITAASTSIALNGTTTVTASGGSGVIDFTYAIVSGGNACTLDAKTGVVKGIAIGTCEINASNAASTGYDAATSAKSVSISVGKAAQTITFTLPAGPMVLIAPDATLSATTDAPGLTVNTFTSKTTKVCEVSGSALKFYTTGTCTVTASQSGDASYASAEKDASVEVTLPAGTASTVTGSITEGTVTAEIIGGDGWVFGPQNATGWEVTGFFPLTTEQPPSNLEFPAGLFGFTAINGPKGTAVEIKLTYPISFPKNAEYWKFGKTRDNQTAHWYKLPDAVITGNTVTFKVTDGGTGDNDLDINSVIKDPGGVAINKAAPVAGATTPVPTLGDAARSLLALMLAGAAALVFRRQRR